ncbi:hypothetical protein SNE25_24385 [Mucilaginibacter sabulilitoris]|uniref:DUF7674 domain-containing protein n=1 Tax=Mucilaginibacter sabulilitoris TaxID=1173583 RepID=A0ABZ0TMS6_9SPHI|nr:hypothetical protein [Mucilaginibacter sabulilitoris]WPU92470.1 hypothetical protein SNE25_24385 [Mucilaginibacter sabulilitoris]
MQFQVNRDEYYPRLINRLRSFVPGFQTIFDEEDGVYLILADFYQYMMSNIDNKHIIHSCVDFINEAMKLGKEKTKDAIVIEIFQPLYSDSDVAKKVQPYLSKIALAVFNSDR